MDGNRFDEITRSFASTVSRRGMLKAAWSGVLAGALGQFGLQRASARGCRKVGRLCREAINCCSGICQVDRYGRPRCGCPDGSIACQGECRPPSDFQSDPANCGACGNRCPRGNACQPTSCIDGQCVSSSVVCPATSDPCAENVCNPSTGKCEARPTADGVACDDGDACTSGETCQSGVCTGGTPTQCTFANASGVCAPDTGDCELTSCNPGYADCNNNPADGCEVNTTSDVNNCGACGTRCKNPPNATARCEMSLCVSTCNPGFGNCDGNPQTGCETILTSDVNNCGACGTICNVPNATAQCISGQCRVASCNTGFVDCDNNPANGCEVNTNTDDRNCGACGRACSDGRSCQNGVCG